MGNFRPTWAEINLDNVAHNYNSLRSLVKGDTKFCCIIKANAYGHGSVQMAKLYEELGADYFGVATAKEALELRKAGISKPIMCLGYTDSSIFEELIKNNIDMPVYSVETAEVISKVAGEIGYVANIHIKLDTGMSRIGFQCNTDSVDEIEKISKLPNLHFRGVFSHFARADEFQRVTTEGQFAKFKFMLDSLKEKNITFDIRHICNSAGLMMYPEYHLDMVRAGIALYGHYPSDEVDKSRAELRPCMEFKTIVSHIKQLEAGRGIGYGHKYVTEHDNEYIGTLPVGYADGFTRIVSKYADVLINGKVYPLAGNICMDQCMFKADADVKVGDVATIFGYNEKNRVERLAEKLGTINYELLCMVQRRIPRVYIKGGQVIKVVDYLLD